LSPNAQKIICRILESEFAKAKAKNPAYSKRAFAKKLGLNSGTLSTLLQNKRKLNAAAAARLLDRLKLEENQKTWIKAVLEEKNLKIPRALLELDRFEIIAHPVHLNALNLLRTSGSPQTIPWLATRLALAPEEAEAITERLDRAGLVKREKQKIIPTNEAVKTPENFPHHALRSFHKNSLAEAAEKLESVPVLLRDFSSITIPANPEKIEQVRELIRGFRDQVSFLLGAEAGSEVYKLSVQFYPVAQNQEQP
jgi:transcriptional regulator with XRE-family HTH domain